MDELSDAEVCCLRMVGVLVGCALEEARRAGREPEVEDVCLFYYAGDELAALLAGSGMDAAQVGDCVSGLLCRGYLDENVYAKPWDAVSLTAKGRGALGL